MEASQFVCMYARRFADCLGEQVVVDAGTPAAYRATLVGFTDDEHKDFYLLVRRSATFPYVEMLHISRVSPAHRG